MENKNFIIYWLKCHGEIIVKCLSKRILFNFTTEKNVYDFCRKYTQRQATRNKNPKNRAKSPYFPKGRWQRTQLHLRQVIHFRRVCDRRLETALQLVSGQIYTAFIRPGFTRTPDGDV